MAIKGTVRTTARSLDGGGMTVDEFKEWLKRFDGDKDGRISRKELRSALRSISSRFSGWKSGRGIRYADTDGDGFVDEDEIEYLMDFAQTNLGMKISYY